MNHVTFDVRRSSATPQLSIPLLAAVLTLALPSFASEPPINFDLINVQMSDETKSVSGTKLDNPCTATIESIPFEGGMQIRQQFWRMTDGRYRVLVNENASIQGRDAVGTVIAASGSSTSDVVYGPQPFTLLNFKKMNTADAFHAVFVMDFEPITATWTVRLEAACHNGKP